MEQKGIHFNHNIMNSNISERPQEEADEQEADDGFDKEVDVNTTSDDQKKL